MNVIRIWAIAFNVFREIFRERVLYLTGLFAVGFIMAVSFLNEVSVGAEAKISLDVGLAGMALIGLAVSAFVGGGLIQKEIEKRTALVLIAKPLSRAEFIVGKHLGITSVLAVLLGIMTLIYMGILTWRSIEFPAGSLLISVAYLGLELSLIAAVAILFGVFSSALIATILTILVYVMGHFSGNLLELSRTIETNSLKLFIRTIYLIFPDLSRLDLKNQAVYGLLPSSDMLLINGIYGLFYIAMILAIASLLFNRRQF
jgi:Cu-processing system permease protein